MSQRIDIIRKPRLTILAVIDTFSLEQLNTIPAGFNNNIIWNLGHMVAAQYGVCYKRAGLELPIPEEFYKSYMPGSKPEKLYTDDDLNQIKELFVSSLDQLEADLQTGLFSNYPLWTTRYGADIGNIDEAVAFLPFHDGLHIGYIMSIRKLV